MGEIMIEFNGHSYSGSVVSVDENELRVLINAVDSMNDICLSLNGATSVKSEQLNGEEVTYTVTMATTVSAVAPNTYLITFLRKPTVMQEMSNAIDALLVMVLEG